MRGLTDAQRANDLECDRRFAAGLCMGTAALAATRLSPSMPWFAALFEPRGGTQIFAPIIWLSAVMFSLVAAMVAAGEDRRGIAGATVLAAAVLTALGTPFARQTLLSFFAGATAPRAACVVAFVTFGLVATVAAEDMKPSSGHAARSVLVSVVALFMASTDASGAFAGILAVMGILFFTFHRVPREG